ncbi:MAG: hypothetical protein J5956_11710 [Ruminococcus sp.]|nr:hypothetical protein [Ruminococcus sp.]
MEKLKVRITFTEELLGTMPNDKEIYENYIATKAPNPEETAKEEVDAVGDVEVDAEEVDVDTSKVTVFPRTEDDKPFLYDYQIKGYFKETASFLRKVKETATSNIKAFKKEIDGLIFIAERKIILDTNGGEIGLCQRPLRASTPKGERVSLSCSETVPAGTTAEFTIECMVAEDIELVKEWLDYGKYHGTGQWRNSGKGRFIWEEIQ